VKACSRSCCIDFESDKCLKCLTKPEPFEEEEGEEYEAHTELETKTGHRPFYVRSVRFQPKWVRHRISKGSTWRRSKRS
jgi:hypothetical protein